MSSRASVLLDRAYALGRGLYLTGIVDVFWERVPGEYSPRYRSIRESPPLHAVRPNRPSANRGRKPDPTRLSCSLSSGVGRRIRAVNWPANSSIPASCRCIPVHTRPDCGRCPGCSWPDDGLTVPVPVAGNGRPGAAPERRRIFCWRYREHRVHSGGDSSFSILTTDRRANSDPLRRASGRSSSSCLFRSSLGP